MLDQAFEEHSEQAIQQVQPTEISPDVPLDDTGAPHVTVGMTRDATDKAKAVEEAVATTVGDARTLPTKPKPKRLWRP